MIVIGVTGGAACGKTTVSRKLEESLPPELVSSFDSDAVVRELMRRDDVIAVSYTHLTLPTIE